MTLSDTELDAILEEHHRAGLHKWRTLLDTDSVSPDTNRNALKSHIDDKDRLGGLRHAQVTITDLVQEVTAHLGQEGALIASQVAILLRRIVGALDAQPPQNTRAAVLCKALVDNERRLRSMIDLDFAASSCRRTHQALDELATAITTLTRQVHDRVERETEGSCR